MFLEAFQFSLNVMLPTILLMLLGVFLRRKRLLDDQFCQTASKLVFSYTLPALIFLNMLKSPLDYHSELNLILTGVGGTILIYLLAEIWAAKFVKERKLRCIFTQGTFRTNAAILGLALAINAYGDKGIAPSLLYISCLVIIFNTLGVVTILNSLSDKKPSPLKLTIAIFKNPLIQAIIAGLFFNYFQIKLPQALLQTTESLSRVTLPMALICVGATLDFKALSQFGQQSAQREANRLVIYASIIRLIGAPMLLLAIGKWIFPLTPMQLGILFLTATAPVASSAYAMTRAYGGNGTAIANLIGITTLGSMFTASAGLIILRQLGWI